MVFTGEITLPKVLRYGEGDNREFTGRGLQRIMNLPEMRAPPGASITQMRDFNRPPTGES